MPQLKRPGAPAIAAVAALGLLAGGLIAATPTSAAPTNPGQRPATDGEFEPVVGTDNLPHPLKIAHKREAQKQAALRRLLETGQAFPQAARKGKGYDNQYVELEREGTDRIFVVLAEFGNERYPDPRFTDDPSFDLPDPEPLTFDGPLHNQIPEPDRRIDNSTLWQPDYDRAHFEDMYFNRMAKYYERQSSGRYSVDGDVTEWVKVPFNQALYGRGYCGVPPGAPVTSCPSSRALIRDALAVWVQDQLAAGQTMTQIQDYLKTFDVQDRYDSDLDENYDEPDGFIDHFQIVHAGGDEAAGDPTYGTDAIWSHRSYANLQAGGPNGLVGVNVGSNGGSFSSPLVPNNPTGIWVGDYTVQPENGGLGVFAHEFAHDLGLPDLYDTSGNTGGAENSTAFWTLMSSGANIGDGGRQGIGDDPTDMGVWELFQLGWLNAQGDKGPFYEVVQPGKKASHQLATNVPASKKGAQAVFAVLPDNEVPLDLGEPASGEYMFWSDQGDRLNNTMTNLSVSGSALTAKVNYEIEEDWDYAFLEATTDGGATWTELETNLSDNEGDQSGINPNRTGITGVSDGWVDLTATLPAGTNGIQFRYTTDEAFVLPGFRVDDVTVDGAPVGTAETEDEGWTFDGFLRATGDEVQSFFNAYVMENRQYDGYDKSLKTAYNFGFLNTNTPDKVESYPYQDGMLLSYWNDEYTDNNVGDHPGEGLLLPVDSHPGFFHWPNGDLMRPRILSYDSTFGLEKTNSIRLHLDGKSLRMPSKPAVSTFDDTRSYWYNADQHAATGEHQGRYQPGWYSVQVPKTGTTVRVLKELKDGSLQIRVAPK